MQNRSPKPRRRISPFVLIILLLNGILIIAIAVVALLGQVSLGLEQLANRPTPTLDLPDQDIIDETAEQGIAYGDVIRPDNLAAYGTLAVWEQDVVTYSFENCPSSLDCDLAHNAVRRAAETWDAIIGISLEEVDSGGDINILWASGEHGDAHPFDGQGGVVAHAALPYTSGEWWFDGDLHFDDDENWVVDTPTEPFPYQVHLPTVALHELGHSLGLDHSNDPRSVMWAEYTGIRILSDDDILGIQSLYGDPGPGEFLTSITDTGEEIVLSEGTVFATPTTTLRFRSGPSTDYSQIGRVLGGLTVPIIGKNADGSWLYVEHEGTNGWIAGWYCNVNGDINNVPVVE